VIRLLGLAGEGFGTMARKRKRKKNKRKRPFQNRKHHKAQPPSFIKQKGRSRKRCKTRINSGIISATTYGPLYEAYLDSIGYDPTDLDPTVCYLCGSPVYKTFPRYHCKEHWAEDFSALYRNTEETKKRILADIVDG